MTQRCKNRIRDNILPQIWENKLKRCEKMKDEMKSLVKSENDGLSMQVIVRLKRLEAVKKDILSIKNSDKYNSLPNIHKIMDLYRSGDYEWEDGTATYWSKGVMIAGPKPFNVKELLELSSKNDGDNGFWLELVRHSSHLIFDICISPTDSH